MEFFKFIEHKRSIKRTTTYFFKYNSARTPVNWLLYLKFITHIPKTTTKTPKHQNYLKKKHQIVLVFSVFKNKTPKHKYSNN